MEINAARQAKWCRQLWWVVGKLHFLVLVCNTSKLWPIIPKQKEVTQGGSKGQWTRASGDPQRQNAQEDLRICTHIRECWCCFLREPPFRSSTGGLWPCPVLWSSVNECSCLCVCVCGPFSFHRTPFFFQTASPWCMFIKETRSEMLRQRGDRRNTVVAAVPSRLIHMWASIWAEPRDLPSLALPESCQGSKRKKRRLWLGWGRICVRQGVPGDKRKNVF